MWDLAQHRDGNMLGDALCQPRSVSTHITHHYHASDSCSARGVSPNVKPRKTVSKSLAPPICIQTPREVKLGDDRANLRGPTLHRGRKRLCLKIHSIQVNLIAPRSIALPEIESNSAELHSAKINEM